MTDPPRPDPFHVITRLYSDAGALFVLQSKGEWWHAGFHLTTASVGSTILTLPYAFRGLGWWLGFVCLTTMGLVTFYAYYLMSKVLDTVKNPAAVTSVSGKEQKNRGGGDYTRGDGEDGDGGGRAENEGGGEEETEKKLMLMAEWLEEEAVVEW